jgi:4-aminobutyrate aminotransferase-like enzyme
MGLLKTAELLKRQRVRLSTLPLQPKFLMPNLRPLPIEILGGHKAILQTSIGEIIDLCSSTENCILGHNDEWVNASIIAYMLDSSPSFISSRFLGRQSLLLAERLAKIGKIPSAVVNHRQCNGSDVTELAIHTAYGARRRPLVASFRGSYHGQNLTSFLTSDLHSNLEVWGRNPNIVQSLPMPDFNSQNWRDTAEEVLFTLQGHASALSALIVEPIQVNAGALVIAPEFLYSLEKFCRTNDIALIFDEVQSAGGWLRTATLAEFIQIVPTGIAIGKAITAGYGPLAALIASPSLGEMPYGSAEKTNGADVRAVVAANAVWERMFGIPDAEIPGGLDEQLTAELRVGIHSRLSGLNRIMDAFFEEIRELPQVGRLQGLDSIRGIEIINTQGAPSVELAQRLQEGLLKQGVLVRQHRSFLTIKPPLVISTNLLQSALERVATMLTNPCGTK